MDKDYVNMYKDYVNMVNKQSAKFWMVVGDGNSPKVRHPDYDTAKREAQRLAAAHPGIEFYVLEARDKYTQVEIKHTILY